jgi:hypothetical protein
MHPRPRPAFASADFPDRQGRCALERPLSTAGDPVEAFSVDKARCDSRDFYTPDLFQDELRQARRVLRSIKPGC